MVRTQSSDTDPTIERMQIEGLRRLSPGQRFQLASDLTRNVFTLSWRNFRRRHAHLDEDAASLLWIRLLYGDDQADRVAAYLEQRPRRAAST